MDNDYGAPAYTEIGVWTTSAWPGWNNGTYRYAWGDDPSTATWKGNLAVTGAYDCYTMYLQSNNPVTSAKYVVHAADGDYIVYINQYGLSMEVVETYLGRFIFNEGENSITICAQGSTPSGSAVISDAVRFFTIL